MLWHASTRFLQDFPPGPWGACPQSSHKKPFLKPPRRIHAIATAEMAVESVHFFILDNELFPCVTFGKTVGLDPRRRLRRDGAAKFGRDHHERATKQAAFVQIPD